MRTTARISAVFFGVFTLCLLAGTMLPAPGAVRFPITPDQILGSVLGLGWFFALWAGLVAAMLFIIAWTSEGVAETEREIARLREAPHVLVPAEHAVEKERELARVS